MLGALDWKSLAELLTDTGAAEGAARLLVDLTSAERMRSWLRSSLTPP